MRWNLNIDLKPSDYNESCLEQLAVDFIHYSHILSLSVTTHTMQGVKGQESIPADTGWEAGFSLAGSPVYHKAYISVNLGSYF